VLCHILHLIGDVSVVEVLNFSECCWKRNWKQ